MDILITFAIACATGYFGYWLRGKIETTPRADPITEDQKKEMKKKEEALKELMSYSFEKATGGKKR